MRILYIHAHPLYNEMANGVQVISMCKELSKNHNVILLSPKRSKSENEIKEILRKNFDIDNSISLEFFKNITTNRRISEFITYLTVKKYIKKINPDFCFVRNSSFLRGCVKSKIPTFYEIHNNILHHRFNLLDFFLKKMLIKSAKSPYLIKFITLSDSLKKYWISKKIPKNKTMTLHSGFNVSDFKIIVSKSDARDKTNLPKNSKIALYTGSLSKDRKIENILYLAKKNKDVIFVVIGGKTKQVEYYKNLSKKEKIDNINFLGYVSHNNIPNYLYSSDILLALWSYDVPTINYCSPLKIFEYMASKRLILAHGFPTIKEVLIDQINSFIVEPGNLRQLDLKFKEAIHTQNEIKITTLARKEAFEKYSWSVRINKIVKEFNNYKLKNNY